jgi:hypothetical protein
MTDTATMAPAVATDAVPSTPATDTTSNVARDANGRFAASEGATVEPTAEAAEPPTDGTPAEIADVTTKETPEQASEKERRKATANDRIKQITAQKYEAISRAERAEKRAIDLHEQLKNLAPSDDYDPVTDMRRAVKTENFEQSKAELAEARQAAQNASLAEFTAKVSIARESMPDIDQHVRAFGQIPLSNAACEEIASSTKAAEIAYFLGRNPSEGYRIANLPVSKQTAEVARLEAKLTTPEPKRVSTAPKPAQTLGGGVNPLQFDASRAGVGDVQAQLKKAGVLR